MNVAILGAGPGGLCAAWNLVKDGHRVVVLEKEPVCGGQSITFERDGYRYDLGPHNIHSQRASILQFLSANLGERLTELRPRGAQIYFRNRRINYPMMGTQVLKSLSPITSVACALSFFVSRLRSLLVPVFQDDGTYETWIVNRFGRRFYDIFFGPYSRKAWGIPPADLSDVVAKKRIAVHSLSELIKSVFVKQETFHPENYRLIRNLYPVSGVGEVSDFFATGVRAGGGEIRTGCTVERIVVDGGWVRGIAYRENGQSRFMDFGATGSPQDWHVYSTLPINEMILMLEGKVPDEAREAARGLDFTSQVFLYLNTKSPDVFNLEIFYFSEEEFPFNRVYDVGLFSRAMVPPGRNAVCLEMTCDYGDETWRMDADAVFERCMLPLERHGLLRRDQIESYHIRRLRHSYPRFRVGYQTKLRTIFDYLETVTNLDTFGRLGLFAYANIDDVMWMAFELTKHLRYRDRIPRLPEELLPDYIDF